MRAARRERGIRISVIRRTVRDRVQGGRARSGRHMTDAEFIAIFDADFLPTPDFLRARHSALLSRRRHARRVARARAGPVGASQRATVALTRAQSLWVDDHHTVQMSWRSAQWDFVNFTGTAGVWRASAIEAAGGWRAASLVEDCELSFRHLFAGYRTRFAKDIVALAELPSTYTAYKAQQKRWTQGWAQVQRLHLRTLLRLPGRRPAPHGASDLPHVHLVAVAGVDGLDPRCFPLLIHTGLWFGAHGHRAWVFVLYLVPPLVWVMRRDPHRVARDS